MKRASLKIAIIIPALAVLIAGVIIMTIVIGAVASSSTHNLTEDLINATVYQYTNLFEAICNEGYAAVNALAPVVNGMRQTSENPREEIVKILTNALSAGQSILGLWTCWEPNAFDGRDDEFVLVNEYHDATGRFVPYIYKDGNNIGYEPLENYDDPVDGEFYQGALRSGRPYITDPYSYDVGGKIINLYSIAIPIIENGRAVGVVGMDISLDEVISVMNSADLLDDGYLCVLSPGGLIASHYNESLILEKYNTTWLGNYSSNVNSILQNGGNFNIVGFSNVTNEHMLFNGAGVMIGDTGRYWAVCGFIPQKTADRDANRIMILIVIMGAALIVITGFMILLLVNNGLKRMPSIISLADKLVNGDINNINIKSDNQPTKNEIALLERAFIGISDSVKAQSEAMQTIAGGDYSVSVPLRCNNDVMNIAINNVISKTNETLNQIALATGQVSSGSEQIAIGAQALASGSTQQAASLEELTSSIANIASKTKENAERTNNAALLASSIMKNAEKGSKQMEHMIEAVNEINDANQSISKVIKAIDDIAFQTNILALNAAVEAARAGSAGKGFAVVAEEVRNLASKSADSAKNTSELIANSIEKAELGTKIAGETAASLVEIVAGIDESNRIIAEIAYSSEEQSIAISQINQSIGGVTHVVQQNSATAQQSAAASQEMSGQAETLEHLVAQFKLK